MFCSKNVGCLLGVGCYVLWSFGLTACVSFGVYFELYVKMEQRTESLDVLRACKISERGGIWNRMAGIILLSRLNEQSV